MFFISASTFTFAHALKLTNLIWLVPRGKGGHGQVTADGEAAKKGRLASSIAQCKHPFRARRTGTGSYVSYLSAAVFVSKNSKYLEDNKDQRGTAKDLNNAVRSAVRRKRPSMLGGLFEIKPSN